MYYITAYFVLTFYSKCNMLSIMKSVIKTIRFREDILREIRPVLDETNLNFTEFIMEAIKAYLQMLDYSISIHKSFGGWKKRKHVELKHGVDKYIRKMRRGRKI